MCLKNQVVFTNKIGFSQFNSGEKEHIKLLIYHTDTYLKKLINRIYL